MRTGYISERLLALAEVLSVEYDKRDRDSTNLTIDEEYLFLAICYLDEAAEEIGKLTKESLIQYGHPTPEQGDPQFNEKFLYSQGWIDELRRTGEAAPGLYVGSLSIQAADLIEQLLANQK